MNILIDSDVLIEILRGRDEALLHKWREFASSADVAFVSPVSICELWHRARPSERAAIERLFAAAVCIPVDPIIARKAGDYLRAYSKSHAVELGDALIAATSATHNAVLWTRSRKNYPMKDIDLY